MNVPAAVATPEQAGTELVLFESIACPPAAVLFQSGPDDAIDKLIDRIEAEVKAEAIDIGTARGRERCRHLAASVTRSKTLLDNMGKDLGEEHRKIVEGINARRKRARERLETIATETRRPLTEWEEAEKARIEHVEKTIAFFKQSAQPAMGTVLGELKNMRDAVRAVDVTEDVFRADYQRALQIREHADTQLTTFIDAEERRIEDARRAEEERLAREAEAKAERARIEEERRQFAARLAAERAEREAADAAERQRQAVAFAERERKHEQAMAAERERIAAEQAERERIAAAEQAKRDAELAEERRIAREAQEQAAREAAEARAEVERLRAEQAERERQEEQDRVHAEYERKMRDSAAEGLSAAQAGEPEPTAAGTGDLFGPAEEAAAKLADVTGEHPALCERIVDAIIAGTIPHLRFEPGANVG